jgi:hypothetical protein
MGLFFSGSHNVLCKPFAAKLINETDGSQFFLQLILSSAFIIKTKVTRHYCGKGYAFSFFEKTTNKSKVMSEFITINSKPNLYPCQIRPVSMVVR